MKRPFPGVFDKADDKGGGGGGGADDQKVELTQKEINERIEKARAEEKAKLYEELNKVRSSNEEARKAAEEASKRAEELAKAQQEAQDNLKKIAEERDALIKATKTDGSVDIEALIKEASERTAKALTEVTSAKMKVIEEEVTTLRKRNSEMALERYKADKIAAAGGKLISALVNGSTEKEIDDSVERAKKAYQEIEDNIRKEQGLPESSKTGDNAPPNIPANRNSAGGSRTVTDLGDIKVKRGDPKNWGSEREKVLARLKQRVG